MMKKKTRSSRRERTVERVKEIIAWQLPANKVD